MRVRPLAIDLFCGLGGWTDGLLAEGYHARGYDIEAHEYDGEKYPAELVLQDVMSIHGSEFKDAALIVASPPCQEYSYMAMPWSRAKQIARALRGQDVFPEGYRGSRTIAELTALFDACFRIQREASEAAGRHIPMVVENVRGAVPWVGPAAWNYGSYYLWGDVPALMPAALAAVKVPGMDWSKYGQPDYKAVAFNDEAIRQQLENGRKNPGFRFDGSGKSFQTESVARHVDGQKTTIQVHRRDGHPHTRHLTNAGEGRKGGGDWFGSGENCSLQRRVGSTTPARKAASARIAKIPFALSSWIARTYRPTSEQAA